MTHDGEIDTTHVGEIDLTHSGENDTIHGGKIDMTLKTIRHMLVISLRHVSVKSINEEHALLENWNKIDTINNMNNSKKQVKSACSRVQDSEYTFSEDGTWKGSKTSEHQ